MHPMNRSPIARLAAAGLLAAMAFAGAAQAQTPSFTAEQAKRAHLFVDFHRESLVTIEGLGRRSDDLVGKLAGHVPHLALGVRDKHRIHRL